MLKFPHAQGSIRCNWYETRSNNRQYELQSFHISSLFITCIIQKLLLKQDLPSLQDYANRFSQKVQNVPQNLRITSIRCETNNAEGPQCWTAITIIAQYDNIKEQTNIITFKISFHILHSIYDNRIVTVLQFSNPAGLWLTYFSKGSYQDWRL